MKIGDKVRLKNLLIEFNGKEATVIYKDLANRIIHFDCDGELVKIRELDLDKYTEYQPKHAKEQNPVAGLFCAMANIDEKVLVHRSVCNKLNDIYEQKNEKYGDSFGISVKKYGLISALTRISDKFNRFEQLVLEGSNGTDDETLLDTCLDTANYFIMTAMELQERNK